MGSDSNYSNRLLIYVFCLNVGGCNVNSDLFLGSDFTSPPSKSKDSLADWLRCGTPSSSKSGVVADGGSLTADGNKSGDFHNEMERLRRRTLLERKDALWNEIVQYKKSRDTEFKPCLRASLIHILNEAKVICKELTDESQSLKTEEQNLLQSKRTLRAKLVQKRKIYIYIYIHYTYIQVLSGSECRNHVKNRALCFFQVMKYWRVLIPMLQGKKIISMQSVVSIHCPDTKIHLQMLVLIINRDQTIPSNGDVLNFNVLFAQISELFRQWQTYWTKTKMLSCYLNFYGKERNKM